MIYCAKKIVLSTILNSKKCKYGINGISRMSSSAATLNKSKRFGYELTYNVLPQPRNSATQAEREEYDSLYGEIVTVLTEPYKFIPDVHSHYTNLLHGNLPKHRQASGLAVATSYKAFESPENITPESIHLANILGWCVDLLLCSWQINDDLMDGSEFRRGVPCWYKNKDVGFRAVNDAVFVENAPNILLKKYFTGHPFQFSAVEWLQKVILKTTMGQALDTLCLLNGLPQLHIFDMARFDWLAKYKATYPELMSAVILGMKYANRNDDLLYKQVRSILYQLGYYFEVQNGILDVYGDPTVTGKVGTDICDGKCTWLVIMALKHASSAQKQVLENHYGRPNLESMLEVKRVFEEVRVLDMFLEYEQESLDDLVKCIGQLSEKSLRNYFFQLSGAVYDCKLACEI